MSKKAVMLSIRPEWVEKILSGEKTIEVRKTRPKIDPPFKCYIYCTAPSFEFEDFFMIIPESGDGFFTIQGGRRVVGEFLCDAIFPLSFYASDEAFFDTEPPFTVPGTCLTDRQIAEYLGNGKQGFGWHISDLKIYDEPKELSDFKRHDPTYDFAVFGEINRTYSIRRPPQSWCYVEEEDDD